MFSRDSRWDRHLPHESREEQPIDVGAVFAKGQVLPRWLIINNRKIQIREITYHWQERRGDQMLFYFSVSDGVNLYKIYLNSKWMGWRLERTTPLGET